MMYEDEVLLQKFKLFLQQAAAEQQFTAKRSTSTSADLRIQASKLATIAAANAGKNNNRNNRKDDGNNNQRRNYAENVDAKKFDNWKQ